MSHLEYYSHTNLCSRKQAGEQIRRHYSEDIRERLEDTLFPAPDGKIEKRKGPMSSAFPTFRSICVSGRGAAEGGHGKVERGHRWGSAKAERGHRWCAGKRSAGLHFYPYRTRIR